MNLKKLIELRAEKLEEMNEILACCEAETRALSEEENERYEALDAEVRELDKTLDKAEKLNEAAVRKAIEDADESAEIKEERAFAEYILEGRAATDADLDYGKNGAIVPTTIANRIVKAVKEICPIFAGATVYNVKGTLKIPVWGAFTESGTAHDISVAYADDFTELTEDAGKFTSIDLGGFLAGALVLIGRRIENNGSFSVVNFIVNQMAEEIAAFIERELLIGTASKCTGAISTTNGLTAASATKITFDELIDLQGKIKTPYQANACWTMHPDTFTSIKKMKDGNGQYLINADPSMAFPYRLLGKPVNLSDNMDAVATGKKPILYGDYSGLAVNLRENISVEVLREKYATQHAIGVVAWLELDSKIENNQKLAVLTMA